MRAWTGGLCSARRARSPPGSDARSADTQSGTAGPGAERRLSNAACCPFASQRRHHHRRSSEQPAGEHDHLPIVDRDGFYTCASGGLGRGLPAAIGVALARSHEKVALAEGQGVRAIAVNRSDQVDEALRTPLLRTSPRRPSSKSPSTEAGFH